jgi:RHS repeat-associated protein
MPITNYYVASDGMGSVTTILDEDGNVLERRSYDAFGDMSCMLPDGTPVAISPTGVDVGFQGQVRDEVTGLHQMGYRWYNPVLGRWLSRDPIGLDGGVNLLTALGNSPLSNNDPIGLEVNAYSNEGEKMTLSDSRELLRYLITRKAGSIRKLCISGHANQDLQLLSAANTESRELLSAVTKHNLATGQAEPRIVLSGEGLLYGNNIPEGDIIPRRPGTTVDRVYIEKLLKEKMAANSCIYLLGCEAGGPAAGSCDDPECKGEEGARSLAALLSKSVPQAEVLGSSIKTLRSPMFASILPIPFLRYTVTWSHVNHFKNGSLIKHDKEKREYTEE